MCRSLALVISSMTCDFIEQEMGQLGRPAGGEVVFQSARQAFTSLPTAETLVAQRMAVYQRAVPRHLSEGGDKKGAAFFNAHTLVTIMLQESEAVRKMTIAASEKWKTGELYQTRPTIQTDLTHGTRFLDWHAVCGKATADEGADLRVVMHSWTDEFTPIDGLSQKARAHKYGVVLVSLVNLPLRIRHYADHVLLLALYNSRHAPLPRRPISSVYPSCCSVMPSSVPSHRLWQFVPCHVEMPRAATSQVRQGARWSGTHAHWHWR